ncbi:tyrosine-type recombinase/integrase [Anaerobacillus sp. MEB173]|uniref:tyrosine-type recombinase/integrase n=1 Tax=Anaerobacillus sp. MEB173 TaxID=3383345 RepID=UPI003F8E24CF
MENMKCAGETDDMLDFFSNYLLEKGRSNNTVKTYRGVLYTFCSWLDQNNKSIQNVTSDDVQMYMDYLESQQRNASTINKIYNTIKAFAVSINKPELMEKVHRIESSGKAVPPECLSHDEIKGLLSKMNEDGSKRNAAIVNLLLYTGVRVSELCALNRSDVQISNQTGKLIVKNEHAERVIPLSNVCIQSVKEYLDSRIDDNEALFIAKNQKRLSVRTVQHTLQQYGVHPHKLRHTFCYELLRKGVDVSIVAELAGHSDITITKQYLQATEE